MQITKTQNQPNFKAKVADVEPLIARHFSGNEKLAKTLRAQAQELQKIGPDATTTQKIVCDPITPHNLGVETTIEGPTYLKTIQMRLIPEQIAQTAANKYAEYLRVNPSAATITNA